MKISNFFMGLVVIILMVSLMFFIAFIGYKDYRLHHNDCLIKVAEDFCQENGGSYSSTTMAYSSPAFNCKIGRSINRNAFKFLPSELEECGWK